MKSRKELKNSYKDYRPSMGVFRVTHLSSGKSLIEASTNIEARWNRHQSELNFGSHRNAALQADWKEANASGFKFEILDTIPFKEDQNLDWNQEVKTLKSILLNELEIDAELLY